MITKLIQITAVLNLAVITTQKIKEDEELIDVTTAPTAESIDKFIAKCPDGLLPDPITNECGNGGRFSGLDQIKVTNLRRFWV